MSYNKYDTSNFDKQYVNLTKNGRLFPTWLMANFKKFKLPEIVLDNSDPCNDKVLGGELRKYQEFVGKYITMDSNVSSDPAMATKLGASMIAGFTAAAFSLPFDLLKSRIR